MKLFLASTAKDEKSISKLDEYVGGFKGKSIAYIPTASNGEEGWGVWANKPGGSWEVVNQLGAKIEAIVLEEYRNESVIKKLVGKDIIWFAGGLPGYLMYWIRQCSIDRHIRELLMSGTLYVGSSAGSMIAGKTLQVEWDLLDSEKGAEGIKPLGLVDFDIFPHYEERYLEEIKAKYQGNKLYLLKDGEEIIVEDGQVKVIGKERIVSQHD